MRAHLRTAIVLALTAFLLAWFLRHADLESVWSEIRQGNWWLLAAALVVQAATWFFRTVRWCYLLRPLGAVRFSSAFEATMIGFAAITLLPARAGEVIRPYLLARREKLSASAAFATVVVERLLDLSTVLILFAGVVLMSRPPEGAADPAVYRAMQTGAMVLGGGALAGLVVLFVLAGRPERVASIVGQLGRVLPVRATAALASVAGRFTTGLAIVRQPQRLFVALLLSFPLWLSIALGIWWGARAFHIALPLTGSLVLMSLLVVGVSVPTPGGVGGYHEAFRIGATALYAAPNDRAVSAAIVLHAISFVPITLVGLTMMAREGLNLGRVRDLARQSHDGQEQS
jgi:glycosyltransferase 2 family protein